VPLNGGQHRQGGAEIGADRSNIEQHGRKRLLQRIPGRGDAVGKRAAHAIGEIPTAVANEMIEQVELGLGLVDENGTVAEPAAETPQQTFAGQQDSKQGQRPPHPNDLLWPGGHSIDNQFEAELRDAGKRCRPHDGHQGGGMQQRAPPYVMPQKCQRPVWKFGGAGCASLTSLRGPSEIYQPQRGSRETLRAMPL